MSTESGPPSFQFPTDPPMVDDEPTASPPKTRPGWFAWAIGAGVVVIAVAAFFVTKSIAGSGSGGPSRSGSFQGRFPGTSGEITAINGTTLTVKDRQNRSVNVTTSNN